MPDQRSNIEKRSRQYEHLTDACNPPIIGTKYKLGHNGNKSLTDLDAPNPSVSDLHGHIERLQGEFPGYEFRRLDQYRRTDGMGSTTKWSLE